MQNENIEEKAINIITNYKYNAELVDNFNLQDYGEKLKEKYNEATLYNQEELKNIKLEILENDYKLEKVKIKYWNCLKLLMKKNLKNYQK